MPAGAISWDELAERFFETGVSNGVLYSQTNGVYDDGVPWNGLTSVGVTPSGGESNKQYADNIPYLNLFSVEEFGATIECFAAPDGFLVYDGIRKTAFGLQIAQQSRPVFGFSWQNKRGNAVDEDLGFVINLAWGLQASPSEKTDNTVNDSPEPKTFSWAVTSTPVSVAGYKATAYAKIDSTDPDVDPANLADLMTILYGSPGVQPRLPMPDEVDAILGAGIVNVIPTPLAYIAGTHTIDWVAQPGVRFWREDTGVEITADVALSVAEKVVVRATPASGYNFTAGEFVDRWLYVY